MARVAVVVSPRIAHRWNDDEAPRLAAALGDLGVDAELRAWYEPADWAAYQLVMLGSPWDLYWNLDEFHGFLDRLEREAVMLNPPATVRPRTGRPGQRRRR